MTANEIKEHNKELHHYLDLIHKGTFDKCLFADGCTGQPIRAHSVSRAILSTIQHDDKVIQPGSRTVKDDSGRSHPIIEFRLEPISRASTGKFACATHDKEFRIIDTTPMDFDNPKVLDMLFFRAMLKEAWTLLSMQEGLTRLEQEKGQIPTDPSIHHAIRLKAALDAADRIKPFIGTAGDSHNKNPVYHIVRRVNSDRLFMAASSAGCSLTRAMNMLTGQELSMNDVRELTGKEPNYSWVFNVIPQAKSHVIVASWLKGSRGESYFSHLKNLNGRELTAAISAELICFCENWFLSPKVWESYGDTKRKAINDAFNNTWELLRGEYSWVDKDEKEKWYDYIKIPNRHQINLFRY